MQTKAKILIGTILFTAAIIGILAYNGTINVPGKETTIPFEPSNIQQMSWHFEKTVYYSDKSIYYTNNYTVNRLSNIYHKSVFVTYVTNGITDTLEAYTLFNNGNITFITITGGSTTSTTLYLSINLATFPMKQIKIVDRNASTVYITIASETEVTYTFTYAGNGTWIYDVNTSTIASNQLIYVIYAMTLVIPQ